MKKDSFLIIHQGAIGDFVLILPFILALRCKYSIDIFCSSQNRTIADQLKIGNKTFSIESHSFYSLFSSNPDPVIVQMLNNYKKILLFSFSEELKDALESLTKAKVFLIYPRPRPDQRIHVTEYIKYQLQKIGIINKLDPSIGAYNYYNPEGIIFIHPGAGSKRKRWPLHRFLDLYNMLHGYGKVEFLIGPAEEDLYPLIRQNISQNKIHVLYEMTSLLNLLKNAKAVIGNDSGIVHLSAFLGIPTVAIFGPSDPVRWKPIGKKNIIIRPELNCTPCFEIKEKNCSNPLCLNTTPETVFEACKKLIF